jgi:hypothetical protein
MNMVQRDSAAVTERKPLMGIRLSRKAMVPFPTGTSDDETCEVIAALQQQDSSYSCQDYLNQADPDTDDIDIDCREKMIEWCYRICDCGIFPCDREMVAIAISYLDRYMMHLLHSSSSPTSFCDRPTFKLAAVTSFYLATKIMSCMQMRIDSLVDLGRGSFDGKDILQMELQILHLLEWKMNPPTVQCFIRQIWTLLPKSIRRNDSIFYRSIYFAELSVYENEFVVKDRCMIAVACVLNAIESQQYDTDLVESTNEEEKLYDFMAMSKDNVEQNGLFRRIQSQLWYLYGCSAQVLEDIKQVEINVVVPKYSPHQSRNEVDGAMLSSESASRQSPVSVQNNNA